jgi:predicted Zn-dependent protease
MVAVALGFAALVTLCYFFVLPPLAEYAAAHMPLQMEAQLGDKVYSQMMETASINQALTKKANEFWRGLDVQSPYLINITVIDEKTPNAFALPGGQIIVYDGIIKEMKDYDEFAALLAHEYTHAFLRHGTRTLSRNLAGYMFVSLLLNDASGTFAVLATNADKLKELSFSRELEHQADVGGYKLLQSKNINPNGMLKLFNTLKGVEDKEGITVPRFISTHPLTTERIDYIQNELKKDTTHYTMYHQDLKDIWNEMKADE